MTACMHQVMQTAMVAGMVTMAVILLRLLLKKAPRFISVALWALVAIRLLCPFSVSSVVGLIPARSVEEAVIEPVMPIEESTIWEESKPAVEGSEMIDVYPPPSLEESPASSLPLSFWMMSLWIAGILGMLVYATLSTLRLKATLRFAVKEEGNVFRSEKIDSPFVMGVFRPRIYVPFSLEEEALSYVLAHERVHIRRGDHLIKPFAFVLLSVYWFQPLLWIGYWLLCRDIEAACDERVIREYSHEERQRYSAVLLALSTHHKRIRACPVAFGEDSVKGRVKRVMNYKKPTVWILCAAIVIGAIASVCLLTDRAPYEGATMKGGKLWVETSKARSNEAVYLIEGQRFSAPDIGSTRFAATIDKVNDRDMTVTIALDEPLYLNGTLTNRVVVPHDESVTLRATSPKNGMYGTYTFHVDLPSAREDIRVEDSAMMAGWCPTRPHIRYEAEDVQLVLKDSYFVMTFGEQSDYEMVGTYTKEETRLVLTEDARLTEYVFSIDPQSGMLTFDEEASYRHKAAKTQSLPDGKTLSFCYEWSSKDNGDTSQYVVKAGDGTVLTQATTKLGLSESWSSQTKVLTIRQTEIDSGKVIYHEQYIDMEHGKASAILEGIVASEGDYRVLLWEESGQCGLTALQVTFENGPQIIERHRIPLPSMKTRRSFQRAFVRDGELIVEYTNGSQHIEAFTLATGKPITRRLLIINSNLVSTDGIYYGDYTNGGQGITTTLDTKPYVTHREGRDLRLLYYAGVREAAVYLEGEYVDLKVALEENRLTLAKLEELCRQDAENGLVQGGVDTLRDGGTVIYSYKTGDTLHTIRFAHTLEGNDDVYVGDVKGI